MVFQAYNHKENKPASRVPSAKQLQSGRQPRETLDSHINIYR